MRFSKLSVLVAISALLLLSVPAFADTFQQYFNPGDGDYLASTTNYGGGDGSLGFITSLGPFSYSNPQSENNVPNSWATWNSPPFVESSTPNVLFNAGFSTLHIDIGCDCNTIGWELEPDNFAVETVQVTYHTSTGDNFTIQRDVDGSGGALLFAVTDTSGGTIVSADITDLAGGDFATAQWRAGNEQVSTTPEPGTLLMLGSGLLGALGVTRRKLNF